MELPKNCRECQHSEFCDSYRGGSKCRYQREICLQAVHQIQLDKFSIDSSTENNNQSEREENSV